MDRCFNRAGRNRRVAGPEKMILPRAGETLLMTMLGLLLALLLPPSGIGVLTNFEGGSVGKVEQVSATHLRCAVQGQSDQDHRNRQADWYYFELATVPGQPITLDTV